MAVYESLNYDDRDTVRGVKEASRLLTSTMVAVFVTILVYICHLMLKLVFDIRYGFFLIPQPLIKCVLCNVLPCAFSLSSGAFVA